AFASRWRKGAITAPEVKEVARQLEEEGAKQYAEKMAATETREALAYLGAAEPRGAAGEAILELANTLLNRKQ
ncbi:MAG: hypothetical protein PHQ36_03160, partial [Anaerolineales bacterium]|nr:hypothetical protein [Anaerolineales bacterium]